MAATLPQDLLVYYGWLSVCNNETTLANVVTHLAQWDQIVVGELAGRNGAGAFTHPDHANAVTILTDAALSGKEIYGYIDCGQNPGAGVTLSQFQAEVADWVAYQGLGIPIAGILLDEFGYDFGLTRTLQNSFITEVHNAGLKVIANGFEPRDCISPVVVPTQPNGGGNPGGAATNLAATDYWLAESFIVRMDGATQPGGTDPNFDTLSEWRRRMDEYYTLNATTPVNVMALSTLPVTATTFTQDHFDLCWYGATAYECESYGWGEIDFNSGNDVSCPFYTRPTPSATIGNFITVDTTDTPLISNTLSQVVRLADNGYVLVDFGNKTGDFKT